MKTRNYKSLYQYIKLKGVTVNLNQFADYHNTTTQTLRNYYAQDVEIIDGYIEDWKGRK